LASESLFDSISHDLGLHTFEKAIEENRRLTELVAQQRESDGDDEDLIRVSNEVFRYAVSAAKLLGYIGDKERLKRLPIKAKGTLRELVFFFNQDKRDYRTALTYAQKWLEVSPNDSDILLYQARCYRSIGKLDEALKIIEALEAVHAGKRGLESRLWRERGLIAQSRGKTEEAKECFREGVKQYIPFSFPGGHLGLARLLLNEAQDLPFNLSVHQADLADQALKLLETAREESSRFDRYTLEAYIEALILAGQEDRALPMLMEKLEERPDDPRWNYRMAEVQRKRGALRDAQPYAEKAVVGGYPKAPITLANILYSQATDLQGLDPGGAEQRLKAALKALARFRPDRPRDQEVADTIRAKVYRT
jgi:tetratricopeptide (TPR) repeat protein